MNKQFKEAKEKIIYRLDLIERMLERSNSRTVEQTVLRCIGDIDRISNSAFLTVYEMQAAEDNLLVLKGDTIIYDGLEWKYRCYGGEDYFVRDYDTIVSAERVNGKCRVKR